MKKGLELAPGLLRSVGPSWRLVNRRPGECLSFGLWCRHRQLDAGISSTQVRNDVCRNVITAFKRSNHEITVRH